MTIGERIEYVLEICGKKKVDLARDLDISTASVSTMCSGKTNPSKQTIDQICTKYGVRKEWLTNEIGDPFPPRSREEEISAHVGNVISGDNEFQKALIDFVATRTQDEISAMLKNFEDLAQMLRKK